MSFLSLPRGLGEGLRFPCMPCLRELPRKLPRLTLLARHTLFARPVRPRSWSLALPSVCSCTQEGHASVTADSAPAESELLTG